MHKEIFSLFFTLNFKNYFIIIIQREKVIYMIYKDFLFIIVSQIVKHRKKIDTFALSYRVLLFHPTSWFRSLILYTSPIYDTINAPNKRCNKTIQKFSHIDRL